MGNTAVRRRHAGFAAGLASLAMALGFTAIPADAAPRPKVDYVAVGDSYTAGTGAGPFQFSFPCDQTPGGYVDLVGAMGRVTLTTNAACHGALLTPHSVGIPSVQEQIQRLTDSLALSEGTELVSITAGANDVGVTGVLIACLTQLPEVCLLQVKEAETRFLELYLNLKEAYVDIQGSAPEATIAVLGYPRLFDPSRPFAGVDPAILRTISAAIDGLNTTIARAVEDSETNAVFIDVNRRFAGHEVNSEEPWIFFSPPTISDGNLVFDDRNFHPTPAGHQAYASALISTIKPAQLVRP
jgi:lysophospholipase L1-like esterase